MQIDTALQKAVLQHGFKCGFDKCGFKAGYDEVLQHMLVCKN
jgi:hypothetical protein